MKSILLATGACLTALAAFGQAGAQVVPSPALTKEAVQETARILSSATANGQVETGRLSRETAAGPSAAEQAAATVVPVPAGETQGLIQAVEKKLQPVLDTVEPQGRALIAQSATAPAMRAPSPEGAVPTAKAVPVPGKAVEQPKPDAGKPAADGKAKGEPSHIVITSQGALYFDSAQSMAVFTDDVVVDHPQFHMTCDELQVYMVKDEGKKPDPKAVPPPGTPAPAPAEEDSDSKIKEAIGKGRKVVIRKLDEHGEIQVGVCRQATYIGESGDVIMREMPQVQRGRNVIIATDPATYMIIKQNGELKVYGPARTEIINKEQKPAGKPEAAAPPPVAPKAAAPSGKTKSSKP